MERELFTWSGWDGDMECMTFYDAVLIKQIGKFPVGTKFDSATILQGNSFQSGVLQLTNLSGKTNRDGGKELTVVGQFKLHYTVGEEMI